MKEIYTHYTPNEPKCWIVFWLWSKLSSNLCRIVNLPGPAKPKISWPTFRGQPRQYWGSPAPARILSPVNHWSQLLVLGRATLSKGGDCDLKCLSEWLWSTVHHPGRKKSRAQPGVPQVGYMRGSEWFMTVIRLFFWTPTLVLFLVLLFLKRTDPPSGFSIVLCSSLTAFGKFWTSLGLGGWSVLLTDLSSSLRHHILCQPFEQDFEYLVPHTRVEEPDLSLPILSGTSLRVTGLRRPPLV